MSAEQAAGRAGGRRTAARRKAPEANRRAAAEAMKLAGAVYAAPVTRPGIAGALVLLDRHRGGDWVGDDGRWVVMHEPSTLHVDVETKAAALYFLRDAAHGEGVPFLELLPCAGCGENPANPGEVCARCHGAEQVPATCVECGLEFHRRRVDEDRDTCAACEAEAEAAAEEVTDEARAAAAIMVNRYRKARTIADALLQNLEATRRDGAGPSRWDLVAFMAGRTDEEWAGVAKEAGKGAPSLVTRALVLALLEDAARAEVAHG